MPVIGRFRLRRESRRAFLRSWVRLHCLAKDSTGGQIFAAQKFFVRFLNRSSAQRADR
jgi:hypothetical protein